MNSNDINNNVNNNNIPCEICNSSVHFHEYIEHLELCTLRHMRRIRQQPQHITLRNLNTLNQPVLPTTSLPVFSDAILNSTAVGTTATTVAATNNNNNNNGGRVALVTPIINTTTTSTTTRSGSTNDVLLGSGRSTIDRVSTNDLTRLFTEILAMTSNNTTNLRFLTLNDDEQQEENEYEMNIFIQELAGGDVPIKVNDPSRAYKVIPPSSSSASTTTTATTTPPPLDAADDVGNGRKEAHDDDMLRGSTDKSDSNYTDMDTDMIITCRICLEERDESQNEMNNNNAGADVHHTSTSSLPKLFVETVCGHTYCKPCIDKWFSINNKCPTCMFDFNE